MAKPTFVLVHGAWHTPAHWGPLTKSLHLHGYKAVTPTLPSVIDPAVSGNDIPMDQESDIEAVRKAMMEELDQGLDVVAVPHSWAGMPTVSALIGLGPADRAKAGYSNSVTAIAGISTFIVPEGMTVHQNQTKDGGISDVKENLLVMKEEPGPVQALFHDVPREEAEQWAALLKPATSLPAMMQPSKYTAYEDIPVYFLMCMDDMCNPVEIQRMVIDRIKANGKAELHVTELHCSHSPFLSRVEETTDFLRRAAGE